jgi:hypothetical protein
MSTNRESLITSARSSSTVNVSRSRAIRTLTQIILSLADGLMWTVNPCRCIRTSPASRRTSFNSKHRTRVIGRDRKKVKCSSSRASTGGTISSASRISTQAIALSRWPETLRIRSVPATVILCRIFSRNWTRRANGIWTRATRRFISGRHRRSRKNQFMCRH